MDVCISFVTGLGLRAVFATASDVFAPTLIGLWEGVAVHQLATRSSAIDHGLAYTLRLAFDLYLTGSPYRMIMVLLWTTLGMLASETVTSKPQRESKRERRRRHSRALPSHIYTNQPPISQEPVAGPSQTPQFLHSNKYIQAQSTPPLPPNEPSTPPSFFLHASAGSDIFSPSPKPVQINPLPSRLSPPSRPRTALASYLDDDPESGSPLLTPIHLPTPPETTAPDISELHMQGRLSTIDEISSSKESATHSETVLEAAIHYVKVVGLEENPISRLSSQLSSRLPSPTPIPKYFHSGRSTPTPDLDYANPTLYEPSVSNAAPLPVPVAGFRYPSAAVTTFSDWQPRTPSDSDPLRTPGQPAWDLGGETDLDELRTPGALRLEELSPLVLHQPLQPDVIADAIVSEQQSPRVPIPPNFLVPVPSSELALDDPVPSTSLSQFALLQPPVAGTSTSIFVPVLPDDPDPDPPGPSTPETLATSSDLESVVSSRIPARLSSRAEALRKEAREEEKKRSEYENARKLAIKEKRIKDALILKKQIREAETRSKKLHDKAAKRYYMSLNTVAKQKPNTIDVHGLRPEEAVARVENAFIDTLSAGQSRLNVIVGKGLHSKNGVAVLKPVIQRAMDQQSIPWSVDTRNAGVLILTLPT